MLYLAFLVAVLSLACAWLWDRFSPSSRRDCVHRRLQSLSIEIDRQPLPYIPRLGSKWLLRFLRAIFGGRVVSFRALGLSFCISFLFTHFAFSIGRVLDDRPLGLLHIGLTLVHYWMHLAIMGLTVFILRTMKACGPLTVLPLLGLHLIAGTALTVGTTATTGWIQEFVIVQRLPGTHGLRMEQEEINTELLRRYGGATALEMLGEGAKVRQAELSFIDHSVRAVLSYLRALGHWEQEGYALEFHRYYFLAHQGRELRFAAEIEDWGKATLLASSLALLPPIVFISLTIFLLVAKLVAVSCRFLGKHRGSTDTRGVPTRYPAALLVVVSIVFLTLVWMLAASLTLALGST